MKYTITICNQENGLPIQAFTNISEGVIRTILEIVGSASAVANVARGFRDLGRVVSRVERLASGSARGRK